MKNIHRFKALSFFLSAAYLLSEHCGNSGSGGG